MKNLNLFLAAGIAAFMVSCNGEAESIEKEIEEVIVEQTQYNLDKEASQLNWKGNKKIATEDIHNGYVKFSNGTAVVEGDKVISGSFTVDMTTITTTDELPEGKKEYLEGHLSGEDYFHTEEFPTVTVETGEIVDGKMPTTINVMDATIEQEIPVTVEMNGDNLTINGTFKVDFEKLNRPGFQEDPESGERIMPVIAYDLNLVLTK